LEKRKKRKKHPLHRKYNRERRGIWMPKDSFYKERGWTITTR